MLTFVCLLMAWFVKIHTSSTIRFFATMVVGQGEVLLLSCDHTSHSGGFLQRGNDNFGVLRKPIALLT